MSCPLVRAVSMAHRLCREQRDAESGLVYLRARYLDPITGQFLTRDPLPGTRHNPLSQHGYSYANNNPVALIDPSGMRPTVSYVGHIVATLLEQIFPIPFCDILCIDKAGEKLKDKLAFLCDGLRASIPGIQDSNISNIISLINILDLVPLSSCSPLVQ